MLYTGIKGYFKKLIIYFNSWRIIIPIVITLYLLMVDRAANYYSNYNIGFVLWMLFYSQSASKKPKEWKMLCLLPSNAELRTMHLISETIGMAVILTLWRSCIYIIELLLNLCTLQKAAHRFIGMDLIIIMLISLASRIVVSKVNNRNTKKNALHYTVYILGTVLICIHIILFIIDVKQAWLNGTFTVLAYISVAAVWYVVLMELKDGSLHYEEIAKPVKRYL